MPNPTPAETKPNPVGSAVVETPEAPSTPAVDVAPWESELAAIGSPEPTTQPPPTPAPAKPTQEPAAPAAPKPPAKPAEPAKPTPATPPKPTAGDHKGNLDPDALLSVEGLDGVDLPANVVETLQTLPARDLRLQSAKLAKLARTQQAKIKQIEGELTASKAPKEDPEKKALLDERTALQKRYDEAQERLRQVDYLKSEEYTSKFQKPFQDALADAYGTVQEFTIIEPDGQERQATTKDFDALLELPRGQAIRAAKEKFGDLSEEVLSHVRKLSDIRKAASKAVEDHRTAGAEVDKRKLAEQTEMRETQNKLWRQANEAILTKHANIFGKDENDPDGNKLLENGYREVDRVNDPALSLEDRIGYQAAIRHRAAALPRWVYKSRKLEAEVARLSKIIEDYENSAPTTGAKDGAPPPAGETIESPEEYFDKVSGG